MKNWTSVMAIFVATLMIVSGAMAQGAGGGAGGGSGPAGGAAAGAGGSSGGSSTGGGAVGTPGTPTTSGSDRSKAETPPGTPSTGASSSATHTMAGSADFTGRHTMEGEVVKVDAKKGHLTLKTAEGNMDLHFPPSALQQVKKGDRIAVELAMKPAGSASLKGDTKGSASPRTDDAKKKY